MRTNTPSNHDRVLAPVACATLAASILLAACVQSSEFGQFIGTVKTEWVNPDRQMRLLDDFAYVDPAGARWDAPAGSLIDGASIPRVLWTMVGSPFVGAYRNASVVHDVACAARRQSWKAVHRMFYNACRAADVSELRSKIMFAAVHHFGPRWKPDGTPIRSARSIQEEQESFERMRAMIEETDPSLGTIESFEVAD